MRWVARKTYTNGRWGRQTASLGWDGRSWVVAASDYWAFRSLPDAKRAFRSLSVGS